MKFEKLARLREFASVNRRLVIAVIVSFIGVLGLQSFLEISTTQCLGIADSKETMIAFETPVLVKRIFVIPGQTVRKGQPLIEVEPAEVNLKLMEVQTELESLESERKVRDTLLSSLGSKPPKDDPLSRQIEGFRKQVEELKRQQGLAVRYAEEDGSVATVAFRAREQVPPFIPVITLTSSSPNLVYGFIHENRLSDFRVGDRVIIEPVAAPDRWTEGKVISIGSRIAPFPDRFQIGPTTRPTYFGRELVVSLPMKNQVLIGEKVKIRADAGSVLKEFGFQAFADGQNGEPASMKIAEGLPFEAGGMVYLQDTRSLLIVSDDQDKGGSPFWMLPLDNLTQPVNLEMRGVDKVDDLESISRVDQHFYALSSLSRNKKNNVKPERNLILRFALEDGAIQVNRALDLRTPLIEVLRASPFLRGISADLEDLEVEAFSMSGVDGYMALKQPQMPDGSSILLRIPGLASKVEASQLDVVEVEVYSILKLETRDCQNPARVTDLIKTETGMYILSNCKKSEQIGQLWFLANNAPAQQAVHIVSYRNGRPEGVAFGTHRGEIFVSSDNGGEQGSDLLQMNLTEVR